MPPAMLGLAQGFWLFSWSLVGLCVGSFLNVAIHRLPREGESVHHPKRSRCPHCGHTLGWRENVPVLSFLFQRGRCRSCGAAISWRYPLVELLTALLMGLVAWLTPPDAWDLALVRSIVLCGLVVATFVDFDFFEIPDEISKGGMWLAPVASFGVPALHRDSALAQWLSGGPGVDRFGALGASLAGLLVGGGVLIGLAQVGRLLFKREAMGFGDVKLLAAGGGFVGPGGALAALILGTFVASFFGVLNMARFALLSSARGRRRGRGSEPARALRVGRLAGRYLPFGPYLGMGIGIVLLAWNDVLHLLSLIFFEATVGSV